ncbi:MAG: hypothetical protein K1X86_12635 [Ignavibacteria bacterium]|nr:hypothetical protein [Ignavibacteria bacterium]
MENNDTKTYNQYIALDSLMRARSGMEHPVFIGKRAAKRSAGLPAFGSGFGHQL